ncbi:MAG: hypothetical protein ABEJ69_00105 [Candidatus Nanohaloarchaea archaeon]
MDFKLDEDLKHHLFYIGVSIAIVAVFAGAHNYMTPDEPLRVGYTEVTTECAGLDAGVCIGIQRQTHETYNYENYTKPEEGTANFYRRVESELMIQAYNICDSETDGMEWTSEAEYLNRTAEEWMQNENVTLLPCEDTFYRDLE